ncbi:MAG: hypothetical protein HY958_08955 [Bacteroidia bacterium]|nr:hypothetical protein [Bacteroidia bacterium]
MREIELAMRPKGRVLLSVSVHLRYLAIPTEGWNQSRRFTPFIFLLQNTFKIINLLPPSGINRYEIHKMKPTLFKKEKN